MSLSKRLEKKKDVNMRIDNAGSYIKSAVYGGLDGTITTFAVVAGVAGASLSSGVILILGFANLIADGISMAVGDYLSTKSKTEFQDKERRNKDNDSMKDKRKKMISKFKKNGLTKKEADKIIGMIENDNSSFSELITDCNEDSDEHPVKNGIVTFISFISFGFIPILTFVFVQAFGEIPIDEFLLASILTAMTLFSLGALKFKFTDRHWVKTGLETLIVGGIAAVAAFGIGTLLSNFA